MNRLFLLLFGAVSLVAHAQDTLLVEEFTMTFSSYFEHETPVLELGESYWMTIDGQYNISSGTYGHKDAAWYFCYASCSEGCNSNTPCPSLDEENWNASITSLRPDVDVYDPNHHYEYSITGEGSTVVFDFNDSAFGDNGGSLIIAIYAVVNHTDGCTDPTACNYNDEANDDDGSCTYPPFGLADCEAGGALCGEGTIWDASLQACVGFNDCPSDLDGDGIVGVNDLLSLLSDFGTECPPDVAEWTCGDPVGYHGYDYATVHIGEQCWFAENLRYLPNVNAVSAGSEDELGTYCYVYGYDGNDVDEAASTENYLNYGALYNFHAFSEQNLCPANFHVPSQEEWDELIQFTGGTELSGFQLKASGADAPSWNGINAYGFSVLPSGIRRSNVGGENDWFELGTSTTFWTSTIDIYPSQARGKSLHNNFDWIQDWGHDIDNGLPVRCIEDSE